MFSDSRAAEAKALISQLGTIDLSNGSANRDAISKAQLLINTLQDPADKAMETLMSVSGHTVIKKANDMFFDSSGI